MDLITFVEKEFYFKCTKSLDKERANQILSEFNSEFLYTFKFLFTNKICGESKLVQRIQDSIFRYGNCEIKDNFLHIYCCKHEYDIIHSSVLSVICQFNNKQGAESEIIKIPIIADDHVALFHFLENKPSTIFEKLTEFMKGLKDNTELVTFVNNSFYFKRLKILEEVPASKNISDILTMFSQFSSKNLHTVMLINELLNEEFAQRIYAKSSEPANFSFDFENKILHFYGSSGYEIFFSVAVNFSDSDLSRFGPLENTPGLYIFDKKNSDIFGMYAEYMKTVEYNIKIITFANGQLYFQRNGIDFFNNSENYLKCFRVGFTNFLGIIKILISNNVDQKINTYFKLIINYEIDPKLKTFHYVQKENEYLTDVLRNYNSIMFSNDFYLVIYGCKISVESDEEKWKKDIQRVITQFLSHYIIEEIISFEYDFDFEEKYVKDVYFEQGSSFVERSIKYKIYGRKRDVFLFIRKCIGPVTTQGFYLPVNLSLIQLKYLIHINRKLFKSKKIEMTICFCEESNMLQLYFEKEVDYSEAWKILNSDKSDELVEGLCYQEFECEKMEIDLIGFYKKDILKWLNERNHECVLEFICNERKLTYKYKIYGSKQEIKSCHDSLVKDFIISKEFIVANEEKKIKLDKIINNFINNLVKFEKKGYFLKAINGNNYKLFGLKSKVDLFMKRWSIAN